MHLDRSGDYTTVYNLQSSSNWTLTGVNLQHIDKTLIKGKLMNDRWIDQFIIESR